MAKVEPKTEMNENRHIWDKLAETDPDFTKPFDRGTYSGTTVNKMYVIMKLTETFGPNGTGWGTDDELSFKSMPNGDVIALYKVVIWYSGPSGVVHRTTAGYGSDFFFRASKDRTDDDALKKAYSDALTNAAKYLGMSADVYLGMYDDNKYIEHLRGKKSADEKEAPLLEESEDNRVVALEMMELVSDPGSSLFTVTNDGTIRFNPSDDEDINQQIYELMLVVLPKMPGIDEVIAFALENNSVNDGLKEHDDRRDGLSAGAYQWAWNRLANHPDLSGKMLSKSWGKLAGKVNATKTTAPSIYAGIRDAFSAIREKINGKREVEEDTNE